MSRRIKLQKSELRKILTERRKAISKERRDEAAQKALTALKDKGRVLSFSPFGSEIDLTPLNAHLKAEGRLSLVPYTLDALLHVSFSEIDCILVPGLGFDRDHFRIGYGRGDYDRFLARAGEILTIGVGFKEQLYEGVLPRDVWDIPLKEILLF